MDTTKLEDAIAELDAEAARIKSMADDLRNAIRRHNGMSKLPASRPVPLRSKVPLNLTAGEEKSVRTLALEVLKDQHKSLHIKALLPLVNAQRNTPTNRAAIESQLTRALKTKKFPGLQRTAPGTFAYS